MVNVIVSHPPSCVMLALAAMSVFGLLLLPLNVSEVVLLLQWLV